MTAVLSTLAPIQLNATKLATRNVTLTAGVLNEQSWHSGQLYPTLQLVPGANPVVSFETPFAAAYSLIGMGAIQVTTLDIYFAKYLSTGVKSTSTDHTKVSLAASAVGIAVISNISVSQDGLLVATVEITLQSSNGTTHPMSPSTGSIIALDAQPTLHTSGGCKLANTTTDGVTGWSIDMGQRIQSIRSDGDMYPTVVAYSGGNPSLTLQFDDVATLLAAIDLVGETASTTTIVYGRPYSTTTGIVSTGATAVSITLAGGLIIPDSFTASLDGKAACSIVLKPAGSSIDAHPLTVALNATAP